LQKIKAEYGDIVAISWKSFPLMTGVLQNREFSAYTAQAWQRASLDEEDAHIKLWDASVDCPASSMPALQAAKCAELQSKEAFERFHWALFRAHFEQSRDISTREVLVALAKETGLDVERFTTELDSSSQRSGILAEYEEAVDKYPGFGIPTVVVADRYPIVGAVPLSVYRRVIDRFLGRSASVR
jgi:predicted DsbA family dithiol-disulfide isomerase